MTIKLIACDLDGTLLQDDKTIDNETCSLLQDIQSKGVQLVLVTGRRLSEIDQYIKQLKMRENGSKYVITANGQYINNIQNSTRQETVFLTDFDIQNILMDFSLDNCRIFYCDYNKDYILKKELNVKHRLYNMVTRNFFKNRRAYFLSEKELPNNIWIEKVVIQGNRGDILPLLPLTEKIRNRYDYSILDEGKIEISALGVNKCEALKNVMDLFHLKNKNVIYFGDEGNDICCLTYFENSYAMGNASERIKQEAKNVAGTNTEKGVFYTLKGIM